MFGGMNAEEHFIFFWCKWVGKYSTSSVTWSHKIIMPLFVSADLEARTENKSVHGRDV